MSSPAAPVNLVNNDIDRSKLVGQFLHSFYSGRPDEALRLLETSPAVMRSEQGSALIRIATQNESDSALYYQRVFNLWQNAGFANLKPNPHDCKVLVLSDLTMDHMVDPFRLFCASRGLSVSTVLSAFDSVEQEVLNSESSVYRENFDVVVIMLSNDWLDRHFGETGLVSREKLEQTQALVLKLLNSLETGTSARLLITNWCPPAYPGPGGLFRSDEQMGRGIAGVQMNTWLTERSSDRVSVVDVDTAVHLAGGQSAVGQQCYWLARMPYETKGTLAVAREIACAISSCFGRSHRALVTDWDNTLWGGEIAELGPFEVVCGFDSGEANAYRALQNQILGFAQRGVLLAGVTRNPASVVAQLDENSDIPLSSASFSTIKASYEPKSVSISEVSRDLGFAPEFMLYVDDSLFEIGEVLLNHPYIDVVHAGPQPEQTLLRFVRNRFFNDVSLTDDDFARKQAAQSLKRQRESVSSYASHDEFLASIQIVLHVSEYDERNKRRVIQLIHKTNQFNLTTKRHTEASLSLLLDDGAKVWVFSYDDAFGPQGIIAVIIIVPEHGRHRIDTWVMSCRVLNRTVEQAMFCWVEKNLDYSNLVGMYWPTAKNDLVRGLYQQLGFKPCETVAETEFTQWSWTKNEQVIRPAHHVSQFRVE